MKSRLISTSIYVSLGTIVRYISGFVVYKVIALSHGPSGIAVVGQFQNFISFFTSLSTGGVQQGVIKYLAEGRGNEDTKSILSAAYRITIVSSLIIGLLIIVSSRFLSNYLFQNYLYTIHLIFFGILLIFFGFNLILKSALNGISQIKKYVIANASTSLFSLVVTASAAYFYGLSAAIFCLAISESIVFFITFYVARDHNLISFNLLLSRVDTFAIKRLLGYSFMALTSLILTPVIAIFIRTIIIKEYTTIDAGIWDGMVKISAAYLGVITTSLSVYYLPTLSKLSTARDIRQELLNGFRMVVPFLCVITLAVFFLKESIIRLLFTVEFTRMSELFAPQLLGDFFKIISWLLSYLMLSKAMTKEFIVTQILFSVLNVLLCMVFIKNFGPIGANIAHAVLYIVYFITMVIMFRGYLFK